MKILCSICARGGSKGVKNKNIRELHGLPLIAHSILQAKHSNLFDAVTVSSDSEEILAIARQHGVDATIKRGEELSSDQAGKIPAIRHCMLESEKILNQGFDLIIDIDCTSPLRNLEDLGACVELLKRPDTTNVITAAEARRSPYFNLIEYQDGKWSPAKKLSAQVVRRQDAPKCYDMNASIYGWKRQVLIDNGKLFLDQTKLHIMPEERSTDIDSELDFKIVSMLSQERIKDGFIQ